MAWVVRKVIVHAGGKPLVFTSDRIVAVDAEARNYVAVAVRNGDGTISRYLGFSVEIVDEEKLIEAPPA